MQQPFDLSGQVVAVTGASSGFGHHFAGVLANAGAKVVLGARRTEKLKARVEDITTSGGEAIAKTLDVRDKGSIAGFLDSAYEQYGRLDCVSTTLVLKLGRRPITPLMRTTGILSSTLTLSQRGWSLSSIPIESSRISRTEGTSS